MTHDEYIGLLHEVAHAHTDTLDTESDLIWGFLVDAVQLLTAEQLLTFRQLQAQQTENWHLTEQGLVLLREAGA